MILSSYPNSRKGGTVHKKNCLCMEISWKFQFQWKTFDKVDENWQRPVRFLPVVYLVEMVCTLTFFFSLGIQIFLDPLIDLNFFSHLIRFLCVFHKQTIFACLSLAFTKFIPIRKWKNNISRNMVPKFQWYSQYVESRMTGACDGFCLSGVNKHLIISLLIYQIKYTLIKT